MKTSGNILRSHGHRAMLALVSLAALTFGSCADDDVTSGTDGDKGANVSFNVSQAQDNAQAAAKGMPVTRASFTNELALQGLTPADLPSQKIDAQGMSGACLIETTTAGIDNNALHAPAAATRANIKGEGTNIFAASDHFATIGYRGATAASVATIASKPWFHDADTKADGVLVNAVPWQWAQPYGKFFGIYPRPADYSKLTLSPSTSTSRPYVDFEAEQNVTNQKDLMTACSGTVQYATRFVAPTTNLQFRHALTAVRFKVGQNLSWNKTITKIEIVGAKSKGRYTPSTEADGTGATWSGLSAPATFTLDGLSVSTSEAVNNIIVGKNNDNGTFYMIPQTLTGVSIKVYFSDGSTPISANLTGTWKPGTTKVYALSQITSNWNYVLNVTGPTTPVAYDQTAAGNYTIQSYRQSGGTQQPVKWKVVGYQESTDGGSTWSTLSDTKPAWLTSLNLTSGNGVTSGSESGAATVQKSQLFDKLAAYNKALHDATPKGSAGSYYNLSNHNGGATVENTANSYLISASGYYKIPLVYGNAIKNGNPNPDSYTGPTAPVMYGIPSVDVVLHHFKDHAGVDIDNPWITLTNSGANAPDGAKIVWTDQSGLVEASSLGIEGSGTSAFVHFHIPQDKIKNGNAVIAVTKGGTVVWSWHLWIAHSDEVATTPIVNHQGATYRFTKQPLGYVYTQLETTTYTQPRKVRIKVEQAVANGGTKQSSTIIITQNPGNKQDGWSTLYQGGRKDALPGTDNIADGSFTKFHTLSLSDRTIQKGILYPGDFLESWGVFSSSSDGDRYFNLWSANNAAISDFYNDNPVVKTIYDPCPVGLKVPASNAYTGFTTTGLRATAPADFNVDGNWEKGWTFKSSSGTETVFFPALGFRLNATGALLSVGANGFYRSVSPYRTPTENANLCIGSSEVDPRNNYDSTNALSVRPVAE